MKLTYHPQHLEDTKVSSRVPIPKWKDIFRTPAFGYSTRYHIAFDIMGADLPIRAYAAEYSSHQGHTHNVERTTLIAGHLRATSARVDDQVTQLISLYQSNPSLSLHRLHRSHLPLRCSKPRAPLRTLCIQTLSDSSK